MIWRQKMDNLGPGRRMVRNMMHSKGHPGSKKITRARLKNYEGKRTFKGCFGYSL